MRYREFIIKNYKAIQELNVKLNRNVIPLIGVNESGKTSILQAILAFDKDKDSLLDGAHISARNRYQVSGQRRDCEIIAAVEIDDEDFDQIGKEARLGMDGELYNWLKEKRSEHKEILLKRNYENSTFSDTYTICEDLTAVAPERQVESLTKAIAKRLPNILYFDDFSDRVPKKISFKDSFVEDHRYTRGKEREWQEIVKEIFVRVLEDEDAFDDFLKNEDEDDQKNYLSDVAQSLDAEIISEWKKLSGAFSSEPSDNLKLEIDYNHKDGIHEFEFKVMDFENGRNQRRFSINERSKGFQWFFNFIMKLKFNPKYKTNPRNAIYLLDEPGSYLHASAQTELLKKLCEIGGENTILYCTHSQYLLDPDIINIADIRIVSKSDGKINLENYGEASVERTSGAFSALNDALHLKFGFMDSARKEYIVTEGILEYYFYKMFMRLESLCIIPGAGCGNLKELISIVIANGEKFLVVLDNDAEGRRAKNAYEEFFGRAFHENVYMYEGVGSRQESFMLEDLLEESDVAMINSETDCRDIKKAIATLFFAEAEIKEKVKNELSNDAKERIAIVERKIKEHFSDN